MNQQRPNNRPPAQTSAVATVVKAPVAVADERRNFLQKVYAPGVGDQDFERFLAEAERWDLDPIKREIWAIPGFGTNPDGSPKPAIITPSISGFRKLADITGLVAGTIGPEFCGPDGKWLEFWPHGKDKPPTAAKFSIVRKDRDPRFPIVGIAKWSNRAKRHGRWLEAPDEMLGINAERMAWRLSGLIHDGVRQEYRGAGEVEEHTTGMRRLWAVAHEKGLDHEQVKQVVGQFSQGETSIAALDAGTLHMAADLIDAVGSNALPDDPATAEGPEVSEQRRAFIKRIEDAEQAKNKQAYWKALMDSADAVSGGWELLIKHAPSVAYARRMVEIAVTEHAVRQETADKALADRVAAEERRAAPEVPASANEPAAQAAMTIPPASAGAPRIKDYDEFKGLLKERGLDAAAYTDLVGRESSQFETWDLAMAALNQAYAEMEGVGEEVEGEYVEVDEEPDPMVDPV